MKVNPIDEVLEEEKFDKNEKEAFWDIVKYAKLFQEGKNQNLSTYIDKRIDEVVQNEIFKD